MSVPITNAGPLIALAKVDALSILSTLFPEVIIPEVVYKETVIDGMARGYQDAFTLQRFLHQVQWEIRSVNSTEFEEDLVNAQLDSGEKAAIYLASQIPDSLLLIDEKCGRDFAYAKGCSVIGTLGILVNALYKEVTNFSTFKFAVTELMQRDDIWISRALCQSVLDCVEIRSKKEGSNG